LEEAIFSHSAARARVRIAMSHDVLNFVTPE
jgi:hypothetical protein